jgi:hypothetical protein
MARITGTQKREDVQKDKWISPHLNIIRIYDLTTRDAGSLGDFCAGPSTDQDDVC